MLRESIDALVHLDTAAARRVLAADDTVDSANAEMFTVCQQLMRESPENVERAVNTLSASRNLERIADLATNIAEDVVFLVEGEVIRHRYQAREMNE
jgi:phosphate transport system protein